MGGRWDGAPPGEAEKTGGARIVEAAVEHGINFFDLADIYARGKSESVFGEIVRRRPGLRERIVIQTKCGVRFAGDPRPGDPGRYDFSRAHIVEAVEGSLRRLQTDHIDVLLLHRPDPLAQPEEVAGAFSELRSAGKVRAFGVSNHTWAQIALLQRFVEAPLVTNQVELSLAHHHLINDGIMGNQTGTEYAGAAGTLDWCRLHGVMIQAWAPLAKGRLIDPPADASEPVRRAAAAVASLAVARGIAREAVALAWLLHHPAGILPIIGTLNPGRLAACCEADAIELTREEWFALFEAARGRPVP